MFCFNGPIFQSLFLDHMFINKRCNTGIMNNNLALLYSFSFVLSPLCFIYANESHINIQLLIFPT